MTRAQGFPHTVIRASAGTGKTYQLALRFIGILVAGGEPDEILATTFTRKAAGEILYRVLSWLAKAAADDQERQALAAALKLKSLSRARCCELFKNTVKRLHALRVGTLDSHFLRVATSFGYELGLPPGWSIGDEMVDALLREEAIEQVLAGRTADLLTLVHSLTKGVTTRSVARLAQDTVSSLLELYRETVPDAWSRIIVCQGLEPAQCEQLLDELATLVIADKRMSQARTEDIARFNSQAWEDFLSKGLASKVLSGECLYYKKPLPPELVERYERLLKHVESVVVGQIARQTEATRHLLERFCEHYEELQLDERVLRFTDVTVRLAQAAAAVTPERLAFRLDGGIRHVLLDEFQDTSPAQWRVLRPLAELVCRQPGGSFFCVGDTKQAIYGWRGGVAAIFDALDDQLQNLDQQDLATSYRSSPVVIDAVNAVFQNLTQHPHLDKYSDPVRAWQQHFPEHTTAREQLKGHVTLVTAPSADDPSQQALVTLQHAAAAVRDAVEKAPWASVGVLLRTNAAVARMIFELRALGIAASEEGGNPLTDSPAVELILSLLKLADHPGDTVARFHLATSPLAVPIELADHREQAAAARIARLLRRQLLEDGYGATIHAWCRRLAPGCDERDLSRLQQLVELAYEYQPLSTLRTSDFRRLVETRKIADPQAANVRVMTIHQAKGLEFDIVFLPEIEGRLVGQPDRVVAGRPSPTEPVSAVCRLANEHVRRFLSPELQKLFEDDMCLEVHESLCVLYVAMTRAIHALHMIIAPAKASEKHLPKTFAGLLRATLAAGQPAAADVILYEHGDARWMRGDLRAANIAAATHAPTSTPAEPIRLASGAGRRERGLERTSPSALEGGTKFAASTLLKPSSEAGFQIGTLFHAWLANIEWLDGPPDEEMLGQVAGRLRGELGSLPGGLDAHIRRFRDQVASPAIANALTKQFYSPKGRDIALQVQCERAFAVRHDELILSGSIDRLVIISRGNQVVSADVIDFKTDELLAGDRKALAAKVAFYSPQIEAYRLAAAQLLKLDLSQITAHLLFLSPGVVHQCA